MKLSTAIKKACAANELAKKLMEPFDEKLSELLDDDCAHFCYQEADGMVIVSNTGMDNSTVSDMDDIDNLLSLTKEELLEKIDLTGI